MTISSQDLQKALEAGFPDAQITIEDLRGDDDHYSVTIASSVFADKTRIEQHKMVQKSVANYDIHALAIKTTKI